MWLLVFKKVSFHRDFKISYTRNLSDKGNDQSVVLTVQYGSISLNSFGLTGFGEVKF